MPTMPKPDSKAATIFQTLLPTDERVTVRPMFGHTAAFVNGNMFAGTFGSNLFVRLDGAGRAELLAIPGAAPFAPMKDRPMKEYVQLPASMLADASKTKTWLTRALQWTATLPAKARGARKSAASTNARSRKKRR